MHLEYYIRKAATLEQHFVHGDWSIIKIYTYSKLSKIIVKRREK